MPALINVLDVHKAYGDEKVLRGIDLSVDGHEVVCLIGPSGCGKSTLLRCINALEDIEQGEVWYAGKRVSGLGSDVDWLRRHVGMVFQSFNLFPHMTIIDNVVLAPRKVLGMSRSAAEERGLALLERFGLADKAKEYPDRMSGGQQQRAAIVRALAMEPQALLLDEITSALDPALVGEVLEIVRELAAGGMTIIMATHEMGFAKDVAHRIAFLFEGKVVEIGPPSQIFDHPQDPRLQTFLRHIMDAAAARAEGVLFEATQ
jgi:polar amino acid transport system ATP-binding protein